MREGVGILGSGADLATDLLILAEIAISVLVLCGILLIRRGRRVSRHRLVMLSSLALNAVFLVAFLVQDILRASNVAERATSVPGIVFWPMLGVHLAIAVTALGVAIWAWRVAAPATVGSGTTLDLAPAARSRHRAIARYYPWLWAFTLVTGLLLYAIVYVAY